MLVGTTREWVFDAAQTDLPLVTLDADQRGVVMYFSITCANSNVVDVAARAGFAAATLPTVTLNSATGNLGVFFSHGGIARGGGAVAANGGAVIAVGALGDDIRLTNTVPTGGSIRVVMTYDVMTTDAGV
jgi:hypothetical protein